MKRNWLLSLFCLALGIGYARADTFAGTTNPSLFTDSVNWCVQYGCTDPPAEEATPEAWTSADGNTGFVGTASFDPFYVYQEGTTWAGNFPSGMGLVYNGAENGNTDDPDIAVEFNEGLYGAGAYIQADPFGSYSATITLFNDLYQPIYSYTADGENPDTGLFLGAYDTSGANVYAVEFSVVASSPVPGDGANDFAIGTLELAPTAVTTTPEPTSVMLLISVVGCLAFAISRKIRKSQEVSE